MVDDAHALSGLVVSEPRQIASGGTWYEGPTWLPDGSLVWSDVVGNRLLRWAGGDGPDVGFGAGVTVEMEPSHHQNGHTLDLDGRLVAASHGERAVVRREADGSWTPLVERWQGRRFNSPNDVVVARDGAVWFTDPRYGLDKPEEGYGGEAEIDGCFVYRLDPGGDVEQVTPTMPGPNGLAFSPDETVLYVVDSAEGLLWHFPVRGTGLGDGTVVAEHPNPDGLRVDADGRVWCSAADGVRVYQPGEGTARWTLLGTIPTPRRAANVAFGGGPDGRTLAITATDAVWLVETTVRGAV
ncbi:SMP-30/gluconolactonase/LRE family protein [Desertihabitans aurantiacus]|uniref:SMP-30/gluconolactonase/LRE family protein n=1 Tax=Desertihabitans aurantiacus TaxID=2282477 RepID=UPI0018E51166|nr:SMP-30/gluconolactonase/LRE family protein [Desertihabitans aurantiacus]